MSFVAIIKKKGSLDNTYVSVQNSLIFNMVKIIFTFLEVFTHGYRVHKWGRERVYTLLINVLCIGQIEANEPFE